MKAKIGVISPYPGFAETAKQVSAELTIDVIIRSESESSSESEIQEWINHNQIEALVARGFTAVTLKKQLGVPVIVAEISSFDIADTLTRAKSMNKIINFIDYEQLPNRIEYKRIMEVSEIDFRMNFFLSDVQLLNILGKLLRENNVIVGTSVYVVNKALALGFESLMVHSSRECIYDAIKKARDISRARRRDMRVCRSFKTVLDHTYDGIFAAEKEVTIFNPVVERITGIKAKDVLGRPIEEVCSENPICRALYGNGKATSGEILNLGDLTVILNRNLVPLAQNNMAVITTFQAADKIRYMEAKIRRELHSRGLTAKFRFSDIVGSSAMLRGTVREARKYARSEASVLITGESGTGKELFAQSIHNESNRREEPFVVVNCAALPENLLESELFGYEDGAFTGARRGGKLGLFSLAHGGTIFLDEIGELSPNLQARLLRVLQEKEVMPVGGQKVLPVNVRVISATNQNLSTAVREGRFRKDLFFRLDVLNLQIPPLRARLDDVPELFVYFIQKLAGPGIIESLNINENLTSALKKYMWPGNVRELEAFVERYVALEEENTKTHTVFHSLLYKLNSGELSIRKKSGINQVTIELGNMMDMEKQILLHASKLIRGNKGDIAKLLGISRSTLWKKLKDFGLEVSDSKP
ncbi:MAG: sigma 54-interacting transcriptional regulator [Bacillota bacterium]